ncbi:MAG TPA: glycerate kinase, partial [bacterium (Candidatus Stahlbacteria)]|nr:glycerate kinase [Candidatus Stahlbacteria bacterium]
MKIVIAPNAFKGSLSSTRVANSIGQGIKKVFNNVEIEKIPLADGGDGTLEVLLRAKGGKIYKKRVKGPLWDEIDAEYGILEDGTAVIEMAKASGLALLSEEKRNPLYTTTYGTGELILDALDKGAKRIIIGVGGSATCDGGIGSLAALGSKFLDANGKEVKPVGENLKLI